MARKKYLVDFAKKHNLKIGTIEDLIKYKTAKEKTIKRIEEGNLKTEYGNFHVIYYKDIITKQVHFVLINTKIDRNKPTTVRVHVQNVLTDTIKVKPNNSWSLDNAMKKIVKSEQGALVFISYPFDEIQLESTTPSNTNKPNSTIFYDYRTVGIGAQILNDIGVKDMILLSRPIKYRGINAFGLNVISPFDWLTALKVMVPLVGMSSVVAQLISMIEGSIVAIDVLILKIFFIGSMVLGGSFGCNGPFFRWSIISFLL